MYREHRGYIWRLATIRGIPAENRPDILHDVFIAVLRRGTTYVDTGKLSAWLHTVADHCIRDALRKHRRDTNKVADYAMAPASDERGPEESLLRSEAARKVDEFISTLPQQDAEIVLLHHVEGIAKAEVARLLGLNINTVYSRVRVLEEKFRKFVGGHRD